MYRIWFLVCILNTMAFEDNDDAKYIDLLPESEKQEFLNRIARRILEEIQSKDSPEQSHIEVTDDQLNAHDAYVQDLLKEESENHKNERRVLSEKDNYDELKNIPLIEDEVTMQNSPQENSENRHHVDLTYQGEDNANNHRRFSDNNQQHNENSKTYNDPSFSVIPVEVVYDKGNNKNAEGANNNSSAFSTMNEDIDYSNNDDGRDSTKNNSNNYESYLAPGENNISPLNYEVLERLNSTFKTSGRPEFIGDGNDSLSNMKILELGSKRVSSNKPPNIELNADITNTYNEEERETTNKINTEISKENEYYDDSHIKFITTSTMKQNTLNISNAEDSFIPLTTELSLQFNSNDQDVVNEDQQISSTSIGNTTVTISSKNESNKTSVKEEANIKINSNGIEKKEKTSDTKETNMKLNSNGIEKKEKTLDKEEANIKFVKKVELPNNTDKDTKTHLRKRLQILSTEYSLEEETYKNRLQQSVENKKPKKYVVYEVSKEKPTFIQKADSKNDEQPYYVPIYNFEPENAYYNAYNNLGPNNDDEVEAVGRSFYNSNEYILDKELYTRSGFKIDMEPKNYNFDYNIDKVRPKTGKYNLHKLNQDFSFINSIKNPKYHDVSTPQIDLDYYFNIDDNIRINNDHKDKGVQINFKDSSQSNIFKTKYDPYFHMDYFDIFTDLRRKSKARKAKRKGHNYYNGKKLPGSNEKDHPYNSIHKNNMKDHVRAVRNLLYLQKEFGFMSPTPSAVKAEPRRKKVYDDNLNFNNDLTTRRTFKKGENTKKIAMDYYWGRMRNLNEPIDIDFDDDDLNNVNTESHRLIKGNKSKKKFVISILDSLGHTAGKSKVPKSNDDNFDSVLNALITVLRDMIHINSESLVHYDWLLSTVELRGALAKLLQLIENAENERYVHPLDLKLLNFVVYLYDTSSKVLQDSQKSLEYKIRPRYNLEGPNKIIEYRPPIARKFVTLPKSKRKKQGQKIKNPLKLWQNWYKYYVRDKNNKNGVIIKRIKKFLRDVEDSLYDLHIAIKHIASITTFTDQNWYQDMKQIFLKTATEKQLLQALLHLSTCKLFNSIEESTKKGAEDYVHYVKSNREVLRRIQNEFVLVLSILERLKMY